MNYIEWLKKHESFDKYVLFLLALDFNISQVSEMLDMPRPTIYAVIKRQKDLMKQYIASVEDLNLDDEE